MKFGEYIKQRRTLLAWTQPEAAAKAGIEQSYLSKLETGKSVPSGDVYARLADAYNIETQDMTGVLFPAELDRLRDVDAVREAVLHRDRTARTASRRWLLAGLAMLILGGGLVGLARIDSGGTAQRYTYRSFGVIQPGESLDVFADLDDEPDPAAENYAERIARRDDLIGRIDEQTRLTPDLKGPAFIENAPDGKRVWRLVGGSEVRSAGKFSWATAPGFALIIGGLSCFFISWRWP